MICKSNMASLWTGVLVFVLSTLTFGQTFSLLNEPVDISGDFRDFTNTYYLADSLAEFDPATATGKITYRRYEYYTRQAFDNMLACLSPVRANEFPGTEYAESPTLPFSLEFISPRTVRIRAKSGFEAKPDNDSLMLVGGKAPHGEGWKMTEIEGGYRYSSLYGSITILKEPLRNELREANGQL